MNAHPRLRIIALALGVGLAWASAAAGQTLWNGGVGNWNTAGNWTPAVVPNAVGTSVQITTGVSTVTLDISANIADLTLGSDDALNLNNARTLTVNGTSILNDGQITLNAAGTNTHLDFVGNVALTGTGTINMGANVANRIVNGSGAGSRLTIGVGQTIRGSGSLGQAVGQGNFTNNGTITADQAAVALLIDPQSTTFGGGSEGFINTSLVRALNAATLTLNSGSYLNTGGIIRSDGVGSIVNLGTGTVIEGGTLESQNSGIFRTLSTPTLRNVTHTGSGAGATLLIQNADTLSMEGTLTNNGILELQSVGNATFLSFNADASLSGTGTVRMSNNAANAIRQNSGGGTNRLTIGASQTIEGGGSLGGAGALGNFTNNGTITANVAAALTLDPQSATTGGGTEGFINNSLVQATSGATLNLNAGSYLNTGAVFRADGAGSRVRFGASVTFFGGTLQSLNGGVFETAATTAIVDNITLNGTLNILNADTLTFLNTLVNNGTINLQSVGNSTFLGFTANAALAGTGTIQWTNNIANSIRQTAGSGSDRLTIGTGQTIEGSGALGAAGSFGNFTNNGVITADLSAGITLDPQSATFGGGTEGFINNNLVQAVGGSLVNLNQGSYLNNGTFRADGVGSRVRLNASVAIQGGILETLNGGVIETNGTTATLENVTLNGTLNIPNADILTILGTFTNNGNTVNLQSVGNTTTLAFTADTLLNGTGTIQLSNNAANTIRQSSGGGTNRLTLGSGQTVQGSGTLGTAGSFGNFTNDGTIIANQSVALTLDPQSTSTTLGQEGFINNGTLRASQATLTLNSGSYRNAGTMEALAGASSASINFGATTTLVNVSGGTLTGGTYRAVATGAGTATVNLPGNPPINTLIAGVVLDGVNTVMTSINALTTIGASGEFHVLGGRTFNTVGALTSAGTVHVGTGSTLNLGPNTLTTTNGVVMGGGTIAGNVVMGDTDLEPGSNAPGTLDIAGNFQSFFDVFFEIDLGGANPGEGAGFYDQVNITGTGTLAGVLEVSTFGGFNPAGGAYFILSRNGGSGTFTGLAEGDTVLIDGGNFVGQITYLANWTGNQGTSTLTGGDDVALFNVVVGVPEPTSLLLLGGVAAGYLFRRRMAKARKLNSAGLAGGLED